MDSRRQNKFSMLFRKDLSEILQQKSAEWFENALISVNYVKISSDLSLAKVYLSFIGASNKKILLEKVVENTKQIRRILAYRIKNQVRIIPQLRFYIDDTQEITDKVNDLFKNLYIPPNEENSD